MSQVNSQTLLAIQNLNQVKLKLQDMAITNPSMTSNFYSAINNIDSALTNFYNTLSPNRDFYNELNRVTNETLIDQIRAIEIIQNKIDENENKIMELQNNLIYKENEGNISNYYKDIYSANIDVVRFIVLFICFPIIILLFLRKEEIIKNNLFMVLLFFVVSIFGSILMLKILDYSKRSKHNFNEYDWKFDKNTMPINKYNVTNNVSINPKLNNCLIPYF
jgi:hypothetical protein